MSDEQWPEDDTATIMGECAWCGDRRPLQLRADPMITEGIIDGAGDDDPAWTCRPCWERRLGDV